MKIIYLIIPVFLVNLTIYAQVGINTTLPDSSAILDLNSVNKGLLIPTMTTTQREAMQAAPPATGLANGLLVFDTDLYSFYFWDSGAASWVSVNPWRKEYTAIANDAEHVTTNVNTASFVGIGQINPSSKLSVNGNTTIGSSNTPAPANGLFVDNRVRIGPSSGNTGILEVGGNANITQTVTADMFDGKGITPVGGIIMFSGDPAGLFELSGGNIGRGVAGTKMEGWAVCNGNNGTPNLQSMFVVGASLNEPASDGDFVYARTETGGENAHQLIINEMPTHNHTMQTAGSHVHEINGKTASSIFSGNDGDGCLRNDDESTGYYEDTDSGGDHTHVINDRGGNLVHENRPPFYAVYYIMRIQ